MFNSICPKSCGNPAPPFLDCLMRPIVARWIRLVIYKDTEVNPKDLSIYKVVWIAMRDALYHLNTTVFR